MMVWKEKLKDFNIFKDFSIEELEVLSQHIEEKEYEDGEVVIDEKIPSTALYLILAGRVKIFKSEGEKISVLTILDENDIFGEVAFVDKLERSASAKTLGKTAIGRFSFEEFEKIAEENPKFCIKVLMQLMKELTRKFRSVNEGLDVKSFEQTLEDLISSGNLVKITTTGDVDYVCAVKYADRSASFPLIKVDVKGQTILIPFHQVKAIALPNKFGHF